MEQNALTVKQKIINTLAFLLFYISLIIFILITIFLGTAPSIYIKESETNTDPSKILIFFSGGGWCLGDSEEAVLQNCYYKITSNIGSSDKQRDQLQFDGILSSIQYHNPYFYDYTVIFLSNCDGTGFQGNSDAELQVSQDKTFWLRGRKNVEASLDYIKENFDLSIVKNVIVAGSQSGGLAALQWVDVIAQDFAKININIKFVAVSDTSLFLDQKSFTTHQYSFRQQVKNFLSLSNADESEYLNQECIKSFENEPWRCFFAENLLNFVETPTLVINSLIDFWQIDQVLDIDQNQICFEQKNSVFCSQEKNLYIQQYSQEMQQIMEDIQSQNPYIHYYLFNQTGHVFIENLSTFNQIFFEGQENTLNQIIEKFVENEINLFFLQQTQETP
ncbi:hypothetical protein PPERSA_12240 [Pseudocohnilembus persalinus]|uniref:Pectinacetylesterase family protein n=1 Tax=Pseudocohnilembus persalinus TaxID=266149 RepID=A0A0V0R4V6_PSEPJ|nr:hypothetical protein PPERSA_12240 [Pseudocohnilembus persalinus]|eukprot:KRX09497.1 hypothetical protein PPERSA_12240 [Pseudocohnilembus persalinus]